MTTNHDTISEELLPCPFCGERKRVWPQNGNLGDKERGWWQLIWCENCGATSREWPTEAEAVAAWNRRASLALEGLAARSGEVFQDRVAEAHVALFYDDPTDLPERRDRFTEEALEVAQATGMTREDAHKLVDYTFSRPVGDPEKEIGAAALTLASLCVVGGWDMMACAEADLSQLVTPEKIAKVRAKRATRHGRGPLPGLSTALIAALSRTNGAGE